MGISRGLGGFPQASRTSPDGFVGVRRRRSAAVGDRFQIAGSLLGPGVRRGSDRRSIRRDCRATAALFSLADSPPFPTFRTSRPLGVTPGRPRNSPTHSSLTGAVSSGDTPCGSLIPNWTLFGVSRSHPERRRRVSPGITNVGTLYLSDIAPLRGFGPPPLERLVAVAAARKLTSRPVAHANSWIISADRVRQPGTTDRVTRSVRPMTANRPAKLGRRPKPRHDVFAGNRRVRPVQRTRLRDVCDRPGRSADTTRIRLRSADTSRRALVPNSGRRPVTAGCSVPRTDDSPVGAGRFPSPPGIAHRAVRTAVTSLDDATGRERRGERTSPCRRTRLRTGVKPWPVGRSTLAEIHKRNYKIVYSNMIWQI